jgi:hypothetical protein
MKLNEPFASLVQALVVDYFTVRVQKRAGCALVWNKGLVASRQKEESAKMANR